MSSGEAVWPFVGEPFLRLRWSDGSAEAAWLDQSGEAFWAFAAPTRDLATELLRVGTAMASLRQWRKRRVPTGRFPCGRLTRNEPKLLLELGFGDAILGATRRSRDGRPVLSAYLLIIGPEDDRGLRDFVERRWTRHAYEAHGRELATLARGMA